MHISQPHQSITQRGAGQVNLGGLLAWEFLLMHWVEVRRWQDYKNFGSVNEVRPPRLLSRAPGRHATHF